MLQFSLSIRFAVSILFEYCPSASPFALPSANPSAKPFALPSANPSAKPFALPSAKPAANPSE